MIELLAPAGDPTVFKVAVNSGADAVYIGLKEFSARKNAGNFSREELAEAVKYARIFGVKVYVAINTLVKDGELTAFFGAVKSALDSGADALILQDLYLGSLIKKAYPGAALHLSTQAGVNNVDGAIAAVKHGFSRVVLARETPLAEISAISAVVETEAFIQGALCSSFSGECYMSAFAGGNSGNRGLCKQPCRRQYSLNGGEQNYAICLADLKVGRKIFDLASAGVTSFKIEGRMRRAEYVAASVNYYRDILDNGKEDVSRLSALERTYNRGNYTEGLGFGRTDVISSDVQGHIGAHVGRINSIKGNRITINGYPNLTVGDCFKILRDGREVGSAEVKNYKGAPNIESVGAVRVGDEARITTDVKLNEELIRVTRTRRVDVKFRAVSGEVATARATMGDVSVDISTESVLPAATGRGLTVEDVEDVFRKADKYPFAPKIVAEIDGAVFAPRSVLNKLRRELYDALYAEAVAFEPVTNGKITYKLPITADVSPSIAVIGEDFFGFDKDIAIFAPSDYNDKKAFDKFFAQTQRVKERYLYLPPFMNSRDIALAESKLSGFDGVYAENIMGAEFCKRNGVKLFAGTGYNVFNTLSAEGVGEEAYRYALSKELSESEVAAMPNANEAYVLTRGDVKVMELIYCPYGGDCAHCKGRDLGVLTDYAGRKFPLRRIKLTSCRFEVYNSATLVSRDEHRSIYNAVLRKGGAVKELIDFSEEELKRATPKRTGRRTMN